jgi:thioesterase domain-containing protein
VSLVDNGLPPIVLVHPVGGDLLCYRPLVAELAGRHAVLGLHAGAPGTSTYAGAPGTSTHAGAPATSVGAMADTYLAEVRREIPAGPYRLAGWSLGGVVAYEMGRRLVAAGHPCEVTMIDPWVSAHAGAPAPSDLVVAFLHNVGGGRLPGLPLPAPDEEPAQTLRRFGPHFAPPLGLDELTELYRVFATNTAALLAYAVPAAPGLLVRVVEAAGGLDGPAGAYLVPFRAGAAAVPQARYDRVPGDHFSVLDRAGQLDLAGRLPTRAQSASC